MANLEKELDHGVFTLPIMTFFVIILFIYFYRKKPEYYKIALVFLTFILVLNIRGYFEFYILYNNYMYVEGKVLGITTSSRNSIKSINYEYIYNDKTYKGHSSFPQYIKKEDLYLEHKYFQVRIGTNFPSISEMDFYKPISK